MTDTTAIPDQRTLAAPGEPLGQIHSVSGSQASIGLPGIGGLNRTGATVGKFLKIHTGNALLIGVVTDVSVDR